MISSLSPYLHAHYLLNMIVCLLYVLSRLHHGCCCFIYQVNQFEACELDFRDIEIISFLSLIIAFKSRRQKTVAPLKATISTVFLFCKIANVILFMRADWRWGVIYALVCLLLLLLFPEPTYQGEQAVTLFRGQALDEALYLESDVTWLVEFYAPWSPPCSRFSATFAELSLAYNNEFLKFGKLNAAAYEVIAKKYGIDTSVTSKNLPTIVLFENGKESMRRPLLPSSGGKIKPYPMEKESIIIDFNLNEKYKLSKTKTKSKKKKE